MAGATFRSPNFGRYTRQIHGQISRPSRSVSKVSRAIRREAFAHLFRERCRPGAMRTIDLYGGHPANGTYQVAPRISLISEIQGSNAIAPDYKSPTHASGPVCGSNLLPPVAAPPCLAACTAPVDTKDSQGPAGSTGLEARSSATASRIPSRPATRSIPPNTVHTVRNTGREMLRLLVVGGHVRRPGPQCGFGSYLAELYPTRARGAGQDFCYNFGRAVGRCSPSLSGSSQSPSA